MIVILDTVFGNDGEEAVDNRFNLIDEPWFPLVGVGCVSLSRLFSDPQAPAIGGNPVEKIALTKLLLAIAQAAYTPGDEGTIPTGPADLAQRCAAYLQQRHDLFYLYGERPFLQMPQIRAAEVKPYGTVLPEVSTGNTTVLTQSQQEQPLSDAQRAVLLICLMGFALGGKKTDNSVVLSAGYQDKTNDKGKPSTSKPGPSVEFLGALHSMVCGASVWETLYLNLQTAAQIEQSKMFAGGVGVAPWDAMPTGENCPTAQALKTSLMGRLLPMARFCLLTESGLHYSEGIHHAGYKDGMADPTTTVQLITDSGKGKKPRMLWVDPDRRPWRELSALLGFIESMQGAMLCPQLKIGLERGVQTTDNLTLWSGGLRVSSNAGEQYVSGSDDFVESEITLPKSILGEIGFMHLKVEMQVLETGAKTLYGCVSHYFAEQKADGKKQASLACQLYWQLCERRFQDLLFACYADQDIEAGLAPLRMVFLGLAQQAFDHFCANETARQMDAWAKTRPRFSTANKKKG
jgi:CRISPR system Cascade subunit CasA